MRVAEKTGKTVEEAIAAGVLELGVDLKRIKDIPILIVSE